jgi:TPR repeat protein
MLRVLGRPGVPQDYIQAHMWFNLAAANGLKEPADFRDDLAKRMTPAQIAEAQQLAREWRPKGK